MSTPHATPTARPLVDELRDFARANIIPINATVGLSAALVCVLDFAAPLLGATGLQVIAAVVGAIALGLLWAAKKRAPAAEAVWRLGVSILLIFFAIGTAAASTKAQAGGFIASNSERARAVQVALFEIKEDVADIKAEVKKTNQTLSTLATPGSNCQDYWCAFIQGAPTSKFKELMARGSELPTDSNFILKMIDGRWPHRFEVVKLYIDSGKGINDPFIQNMPLAPQLLAGAQIAVKQYAAGSEISMAQSQLAACHNELRYRWLEVAVLAKDQELESWLIKEGANPKLENSWCKASGKRFSVEQFKTLG